jgi:hypothetical protein
MRRKKEREISKKEKETGEGLNQSLTGNRIVYFGEKFLFSTKRKDC